MKIVIQKQTYGDGVFLKDIDLVFEDANTSIVLIGPNGSGKTTILKCVCGILDFEGNLSDFNELKVSYLPQILDIGPLKNSQLADLLNSHYQSQIPHRVFNSLSGGEQKIELLNIIENRAHDLLVLDEPDSSLDLINQKVIQEKIIASNNRKLITTHNLEFAYSVGEHFLFVKEGSIVKKVNKKNSNLKGLKESYMALYDNK